MKFRFINKLFANLFGYFWIPCPLCKKYFGGHEWKYENTLMLLGVYGKGVCPDCSERVKKINLENDFNAIGGGRCKK